MGIPKYSVGLVITAITAFLSIQVFSAPFPAFQWSAGPERVTVTNLALPGSNTENPGRPAVAFDGTNHLVVTYRMIDRTNTILGALVSSNGNVIRAFEIAQIVPHFQASRPAVAFAGTNFLVTFINNGTVRGVRVSRQGSPLDTGDGLLIADNDLASHGPPAVASDGERFLVVWSKYDYRSSQQQIRGVFVGADGNVSAEFPVGNSVRQENVAITFGGGAFFAVWEDGRWAAFPTNYSDISGTRISASGVVLDPDGLQIGRAPGDQLEPDVAFAGTNFFVVWEDERNAGDVHPDIFGTRVSIDGVVLDNPAVPNGRLLVASEHDSGVRWPRVTSDGSRFCVAWTVNGYTSNPGGELVGIYLARFTPNGDLLDGTNALSAGILVSRPASGCSSCRVVHPEINFDGEGYFLAYSFNRELGAVPLKDVRSMRMNRLLALPAPRGTLPVPALQPDGCVEFTIVAALGQSFVLEASPDLMTWQEIETQHSTAVPVQLRDCASPRLASRFYRVRQEQ